MCEECALDVNMFFKVDCCSSLDSSLTSNPKGILGLSTIGTYYTLDEDDWMYSRLVRTIAG